MTTRQFEKMIRTGKVSVWTGSIRCEDELLGYVDDGEFGNDFDFQFNQRARREMAAQEIAAPISELVEGFSYWEHFAAGVVDQASALGIKAGNSMVVLYAFEYVPSARVNPLAPLKFVGTFDF